MPKEQEQRKLAAGSVIFNSDRAILMGMKLKFMKWEFPGGKIDPNEPITLGGLRELYEETAIQPESYEFVGTLDHPKWLLFGFTGTTYNYPKLMEPDKHWKWRFFTLEESQIMLREGKMTDVTTLVFNKWVLSGLYKCFNHPSLLTP